MGVLDWLGLRRKKQQLQADQQQQVQLQEQIPQEQNARDERPRYETQLRELRTRITDSDLEHMAEWQKTNTILKIVTEVLDELKPPDENGTRASRLALLLEQSGKSDRAAFRKALDQLDVDELILKYLRQPLLIEEVSEKIGKTYGYTASRLRVLRRQGKVTRYRDSETNKYKYTRLHDIGKTLGLEQTKVIGVGGGGTGLVHNDAVEGGADLKEELEPVMGLDDDEGYIKSHTSPHSGGDGGRTGFSRDEDDESREGGSTSIFRRQKTHPYGTLQGDDSGNDDLISRNL